MKRTATFVAACLVLLGSPLVRAEGTLSDLQLEAIRANCVDAQIVIQRVQESEKLARINRGYLYEATSKLMVNFNSRVAQNKINAPDLLSITSNYQKALDDFRANYNTYDDSLTQLTRLDCRSEPTTFNDELVSARDKRRLVAESVMKLDTWLDAYQTTLTAISLKVSEEKP